MKEKILIILICILSLCTLTSCKEEKNSEIEKYLIKGAEEKVAINSNIYLDNSFNVFLNKIDQFALKLTCEIYDNSNGKDNVCISPLSVYMALALACECANNQTRTEILEAVGVTYSEVSEYTKYLYTILNKEFTYRDMYGKEKVLAFEELSNSIWADKDLDLLTTGINNLSTNYNCDLFKVSFSKIDEASKAINQYIKNKTHNLIDGNVELSPDTLITLINTFYLKEVWNSGGNELKLTPQEYDFMNYNDKVTRTKLLQGYYVMGKVYEDVTYTTFYTTTQNGFKLQFILPKVGYELKDVFTYDNLSKIKQIKDYGYIDEENKQIHHTRTLFPEFKSTYDGSIKTILNDKFKIKDLFNRNNCNFSNITNTNIYCNDVIHKCALEVTRKGIEGAAVTIVGMAGASGPDIEYQHIYHDYIINKTFGFILTDQNGITLFSGVVNNI